MISEPLSLVNQSAAGPQQDDKTEENCDKGRESPLEKDLDDNSDDQADFYGFEDKETFVETRVLNKEIDDLERDNYGELKSSKIKYRRKSTEVTQLMNR